MRETDFVEDQVPRMLAYRIYRQEYDPRGLTVKAPAEIVGNDFEIEVTMPERQQPWHLDIYNLALRTSIEDFPGTIRRMVRHGNKYLTDFTTELKEFKER